MAHENVTVENQMLFQTNYTGQGRRVTGVLSRNGWAQTEDHAPDVAGEYALSGDLREEPR